MPVQTFGNPQITGQTLEDLRQSTQFWMQRLFNHIDQLAGLRGTPTFHANIDANGKRLTGLGLPTLSTDAERVDMSLRSSTPGGMYNAQGRTLENLASAVALTDGVNLGQLRDELTGITILDEPFVVASASDDLTAERVLTPEASVLTVTDNGANSTIVVGIATNGVTNAKLRQGVATSVIGRSANSLGNVADIAASADGQLFGRFGGTLSFSATPTATEYQVSGTKVVGAQGAAVADASGGTTIDAEARTAINTLLARLRTHGLIAT